MKKKQTKSSSSSKEQLVNPDLRSFEVVKQYDFQLTGDQSFNPNPGSDEYNAPKAHSVNWQDAH